MLFARYRPNEITLTQSAIEFPIIRSTFEPDLMLVLTLLDSSITLVSVRIIKKLSEFEACIVLIKECFRADAHPEPVVMGGGGGGWLNLGLYVIYI
jgi:hypothetical protein